jgi:hypothetical protein
MYESGPGLRNNNRKVKFKMVGPCTVCSPAKRPQTGEVGEESPTLLGRVGRRRGCFIVHRENIQLLEIGVCRIKLL